MQRQLQRLECYALRIDGIWWAESQAALEKVRTRSGGHPEAATKSRADFVKYLSSLPTSYCQVSDQYCDLPTAGDRWLNSLSGPGEGPDSLRLGQALRNINKAYESYFQTIEKTGNEQTSWLGRDAELGDQQRDMFFALDQLLKLRRGLAVNWALIKYDSCARCLLLTDYDRLVSVATTQAGTATRVLTGQSAKGEALSINLEQITFENLKHAHLDIEAWWTTLQALEVARKNVLVVSKNDGDAAAEFVRRTRETEQAKSRMLDTLTASLGKGSSLNQLKPADMSRRRNAHCGAMVWDKG